MMARSALGSLAQYVTAIATQASADAYRTVRIETGISTAAKYAWMIDRVEFFWEYTAVKAWIAGACDAEAQLTQGNVPQALIAPDEADFICRSVIVNRSDGTEANFQTLMLRDEWQAPENFVVVDPAIQISRDRNATGQANH